MKYILVVRKFKEDEVNIECSLNYKEDEDSFNMYLDAFIENIKNIESILNVKNNEGSIIIETPDSMTKDELTEKLNSCFDKVITCNLRVVSLEVK